MLSYAYLMFMILNEL